MGKKKKKEEEDMTTPKVCRRILKEAEEGVPAEHVCPISWTMRGERERKSSVDKIDELYRNQVCG